MAKKYDDDPDRIRPPQRCNDERRIGQEKKLAKNNVTIVLRLLFNKK